MFGQYGPSETLKNLYSLLLTKFLYPGARLVRRPFYLRGSSNFEFGTGFTTGYGCRFDLAGEGKTLIIGKNCRMNDRVHIVAHENVRIGNDVLLASNIFISDTSHGDYERDTSPLASIPCERDLVTRPVSIGNKVWIGEGVSILPGVSLGDGCIVGANAVVTKSFSPGTIIAGVPAKAIKSWDAVGQTWRSYVND